MTRIAVCLLFAALAGCKDQRSEPAPPARYEAVKAPAASASRWCDNSFVGAAPRLTLPPLAAPAAGRGQASLPAGKRVWLDNELEPAQSRDVNRSAARAKNVLPPLPIAKIPPMLAGETAGQ